MLIRIIDIGSNSIKSSVYDVQNQDHKVVAKDKLSFSIGEEVFSQGSISDSGQDKVSAFIQGLPSSSNGERIHFTFALATSAVRSAKNRDAFVKRVQQKTGLQARVLSGGEESFLIHTGMISKAGVGAQETVKTIDIGGGSAEISGSRGFEYLFGHSYDLGAIRLSNLYLKGKPLSGEVFAQIQELASVQFKAGFPDAPPPASGRAFGSSGNIRAIGRMVESLRGTPFVKLLPEITVGSLEDIAEIAHGKSAQNLQSLFNITLERARIIMPAVAVLSTGMRFFGIRRLAVSEAGLREGAAYFWSKHGHMNLPVPPHGSAALEGKAGQA